jgi:hypothetical protein
MRVEWVKEAAEGRLASAAGRARRIVKVFEIGRGAVRVATPNISTVRRDSKVRHKVEDEPWKSLFPADFLGKSGSMLSISDFSTSSASPSVVFRLPPVDVEGAERYAL